MAAVNCRPTYGWTEVIWRHMKHSLRDFSLVYCAPAVYCREERAPAVYCREERAPAIAWLTGPDPITTTTSPSRRRSRSMAAVSSYVPL